MKTTIESLVRQIVRDELAKWQESRTSIPSSPSPHDIPLSSLSAFSGMGCSSPKELEHDVHTRTEHDIYIEELAGLPLYEADMALKKRWGELKSAWILAFPAVDLAAEIKKAHAWEQSNPRRKKTDRAKYLYNWLARSQQSAWKDKPAQTDYSWMDKDGRRNGNAV